nr:bifunctional glycosyltransferase 87/phosphatase PAP2 family protein [Streptomyces cavernae]
MAGARLGAVRAVLWLLAALLAVRQTAEVLGTPRGERLTDLETWVGPYGVLHVSGSLYDSTYDSTEFTGTPFGGLVLKPLTNAAEQALGWGWTFGTLLLVVALGLVAARALPGPVSRRTSLLAAPVAISLLMLSLPVRNTFTLGQVSVLPVLLVLLGCFVVKGERVSGILIGLGAALQPTLLLFAPLLLLTRRRRAAVSTGVTFAATAAVAWVAMPRDSWTYWVHHMAGVGLGNVSDGFANQSLHGALLRFGLQGPVEVLVFCLLAAAVTVFGMRRAVKYARDGQLLLAVALTGCVSVAIAPTAWQHQLLWVLLAAVGRVGKRSADRPVWPVTVVLVMTLSSELLLPKMKFEFMQKVGATLPLAVAIVAACAVPFLLRTSEHWQRPVPTVYEAPVPARWAWIPLLPFWRRVLSRPNLLLELLLIRIGFAAYTNVRAAATGSRPAAEEHAEQILTVERFLHLDFELEINRWVAGVNWLEAASDYYYETFHFLFPLLMLGFLYVWRPALYRWGRTPLGFATLLALLGFWLYPLAPPRLMPDMGFIDTINGAQDLTEPKFGGLTELTNQYAAMPSLHIGWSFWFGIMFFCVIRHRALRLLGFLHPAITLFTIVATANHWLLDAVGGVAVVAAGFALQYVLCGPRSAAASAGKDRGDSVSSAAAVAVGTKS